MWKRDETQLLHKATLHCGTKLARHLAGAVLCACGGAGRRVAWQAQGIVSQRHLVQLNVTAAVSRGLDCETGWCSTRVSYQSVPQECPTRAFPRMSEKTAPTTAPHKPECPNKRGCPTRVSQKTVRQKCPGRELYNSVLQDCPTSVPDMFSRDFRC